MLINQKTKGDEYQIDNKDRIILNALQENGRMTLKDLAKKTSLAIDTVKARLERLEKNEVLYIGAQIYPKRVGFPIVADVNIKLQNNTEENTNKFIAYLKAEPQVTTILAIMGDYDFTIVIVAKDTDDLEQKQREIRNKFNSIIADWRGQIIMKTYKFEEYEL